ncbi:MAG: flagellin [Sphingomonas sp.]|nr:flagellin [Sphingomonas sp.]
MAQAISRAQTNLANTQAQLDTGKKASDFADLGTEAVRNLSAHTMLARQEANSAVSKRVGTTLDLYQGNIEGLQDSITDLKQRIMTVIGTGDSSGLQETIEGAFQQLRTTLNASEGGVPLFSGSQSNPPFAPTKLADAATMPASSAFSDDNIRSTARVAEHTDMTYGIGASDLGKNLYSAFQTLAQGGAIGAQPTAAQLDALKQAVAQLDPGIADIATANASNGHNQSQIETLTERGDKRTTLLNQVIQDNEDADLGQVAIDLAQQKTVLEASYSVFSQLSSLSLVNFLR